MLSITFFCMTTLSVVDGAAKVAKYIPITGSSNWLSGESTIKTVPRGQAYFCSLLCLNDETCSAHNELGPDDTECTLSSLDLGKMFMTYIVGPENDPLDVSYRTNAVQSDALESSDTGFDDPVLYYFAHKWKAEPSYAFNLKTRTFSETELVADVLPDAAEGSQAVCYKGNEGILFKPFNVQAMWAFHNTNSTFSQLASKPLNHRFGTLVALNDECTRFIYVGGADPANNVKNNIEIYDAVADEWPSISLLLPITLYIYGVARIPGTSRVFFLGGSTNRPISTYQSDKIDEVDMDSETAILKQGKLPRPAPYVGCTTARKSGSWIIACSQGHKDYVTSMMIYDVDQDSAADWNGLADSGLSLGGSRYPVTSSDFTRVYFMSTLTKNGYTWDVETDEISEIVLDSDTIVAVEGSLEGFNM